MTRLFEDASVVNRTSTGVPGLDQLIEGGFPANRAIVLCGGAGTGKTTFGLQFIAQGLERGEAGTFVTVDEKPRHLVEDAAGLGLDLEAAKARGALAILEASPYFTATRGARSGLDARQVASDLSQQVRKITARRLVIDSITSLVPADMDRAHAHDYLRSLIQSLEDNLGCTILLTCRASRTDPHATCEAARYLTSGVIELRLRRRGMELVRSLCVRKMRGTQVELFEYPVQIERGVGLSVFEHRFPTVVRGQGPAAVLSPR